MIGSSMAKVNWFRTLIFNPTTSSMTMITIMTTQITTTMTMKAPSMITKKKLAMTTIHKDKKSKKW
jgi:hypothetical protein